MEKANIEKLAQARYCQKCKQPTVHTVDGYAPHTWVLSCHVCGTYNNVFN